MRILACSFLVVLGWSFSLARVYVVSQTGSDTNPGTLQNPWRSIGKANSTLVAGDTVFMRAGRYHEQIEPLRSGSSGREIVYARYSDETVIVDGIPTTLEVAILATDYVVLDGLTIESQAFLTMRGKSAYWVRIDGSHVVLRNCRVVAQGDPRVTYWQQRAYSRGIVTGGQHITIEHCFIRGQVMGVVLAGPSPRYVTLRYDTLFAHGASNIVILSPDEGLSAYQGNLIEYCVLDTSFEEDNIQFEPNYDNHAYPYNRGTVIRSNRLGNAAENCIDFKGAAMILVEGNQLYGSWGDNDGPVDGSDDHGGAGLELGAGDVTAYVIVRDNVFWDNHTGGKLYNGYHYYNNVFLNNRRSHRGSNGTYAGNDFAALHIWNIVENERAFINNIVAGQPNAGVLLAKVHWGEKLLLDNNLYFCETGPITVQHDLDDGYLKLTGLHEWQQALSTTPGYEYMMGKEFQSLETDPKFVNSPFYPVGFDSSWDFRLSSGSPGLGGGRFAAIAMNSGNQATTLTVDDPYFFSDGYGGVPGDLLKIGTTEPVRVASIDYAAHTLELEEPRSWQIGNGVHTSFDGIAPNMGLSTGGTLPQKADWFGNLLLNPGFEEGTVDWNFQCDGNQQFETTSSSFAGIAAGRVVLNGPCADIRLSQDGLILQRTSRYVLRFVARTETGASLGIMIHGRANNISYGLGNSVVSLDRTWRSFVLPFTTESLSNLVNDGVLSLTLSTGSPQGDIVDIDEVSLVRLNEASGVQPLADVPPQYGLAQNYPNPFNPSTVIRFSLPSASNVSLKVYDIRGAEVAELVYGTLSPGTHETVFDARTLASGTYLCVLRTDAFVETRKMVLLQ